MSRLNPCPPYRSICIWFLNMNTDFISTKQVGWKQLHSMNWLSFAFTSQTWCWSEWFLYKGSVFLLSQPAVLPHTSVPKLPLSAKVLMWQKHIFVGYWGGRERPWCCANRDKGAFWAYRASLVWTSKIFWYETWEPAWLSLISKFIFPMKVKAEFFWHSECQGWV